MLIMMLLLLLIMMTVYDADEDAYDDANDIL